MGVDKNGQDFRVAKSITDLYHDLEDRGMTKDEDVEHMIVLLQAYDVYLERNETYRDLWRQYGWMDSLLHVRSKVARLLKATWARPDNPDIKAAEDSAIDALNYVAFFIRNLRDKNPFGSIW